MFIPEHYLSSKLSADVRKAFSIAYPYKSTNKTACDPKQVRRRTVSTGEELFSFGEATARTADATALALYQRFSGERIVGLGFRPPRSPGFTGPMSATEFVAYLFKIMKHCNLIVG
jgi:hypothetical protein